MTFLEICRRVRQECGIAGTGPVTTVNQSGEYRRIVDWVNQAYQEIQLDRDDFDFMRKSFTFNTVANKQSYSVGAGGDIPLLDFGDWRKDSVRAYLQSAGIATQIILSQYHSYAEFRDFYLLGSRNLVTGRPLYYTIAPDKSIMLGFTPNDVYVVTGEYFITPDVLSGDSDTPIIPERYHMAIVYKAMMKYGTFEVAPEQINAGKEGYTMLMNQMRRQYTPEIGYGPSFI